VLRIGIFVCWCGENIARTVDIARVVEAAREMPFVAFATDYRYMCSSPGQQMIKDKIREEHLTGVIVAACSPHMHEITFRQAAAEAGLNPYLAEMANIREHCSWVHGNKELATEKAIELIRIMVGKVSRDYALQPIRVPMTRRALVIGGGVAGIQTAIDIGDGGGEVVLVEREPSIGGHMSQLSETFPTLDCSQCILTPKMVEVSKHKNIRLHTYSEIEEVNGYIGNFEVKIRKKARSVDLAKCTGCGDCWNKCPVKKIPSEFECGLGFRTAIYVPFPQAVPAKPVIDREHCLKFQSGKCGICAKICPTQAIDYSQEDEIITEKVGAIVAATGYATYDFRNPDPKSPMKGYGEYGYGKYPDVIDGLQFERLASASGPTQGEIRRPSDGKIPETVVFIECVGSRDPQKGVAYCSKICCMYTAKHTMLYKHKVHHGRAYNFYMDIRAGGKDYEEFVRRAIEQEDATYVRGRISRIYQEGEKLIVKGTDTLSGTQVEVAADMVVLATAVIPQRDADTLAQKLGISYNKYNFYSEAHPKLRPVETNTGGIFLAGVCNGPKDIPEAVAMGTAAAGKVLALFSNDELERSPVTALVRKDICSSCFFCERVCPYSAIEREEIRDRDGRLIKEVARVNKGLCTGCGTCVSACPSGVIDLEGFTDDEVFAELSTLAPFDEK
jgi:heterodisulfide reductase subunit A